MKPISPTKALDKLHPLQCVFVVSVDEKGKPNGMTASWFFQTSFEPPMVAVAIGKDRFTYSLIKDSKEFVIAIPNKKLIKTALIFGHTSGKDTDKFEKSGVKTAKAKCIRSPLIAEATLNYECKVVNMIDTGDHSIFIGEVVASWINENEKVLMNMGRTDGKRLFEEF